MYTKDHNQMVEEKCYTIKHIEKVLKKIEANFPKYFDLYLKSQKSHISEDRIDKLYDRFLVDNAGKRIVFDEKLAFMDLNKVAISDFQKDRKCYLELFDKDSLEEYKDDPGLFKTVALKVETSIIRKTIQNKYAKKLDKFRASFNRANPSELLQVVTRLASFAQYYISNTYDREEFESILYYKDFGFTVLDSDEYTSHGVIGGGIKSTMLYKNYPEVFSCRSRMGIWALWYLVDKDPFDCEMDSEFLMIDVEKNFIQQNYFYPYELYAFYALRIFLMIEERAKTLGLVLDVEYRFVYVEAFLNFVATQNIDEINFLSEKFEENAYA